MPETSTTIPPGYRPVTRISYTAPMASQTMKQVRIGGRPWWKFWLPKSVVVFSLLEAITHPSPDNPSPKTPDKQ